MRKIFLLCLLASITAFGQVVEIAKLSAGTLVDRTTLWDSKNKDVYGYFYIFHRDKIEKTEDRYEYVLLDKNLNKVASGEFIEKSKTGKTAYYSFYPRYVNGFISIGIGESTLFKSAGTKYRLLDVEKNEMTDSFILSPENLEKIYNPPVQKPKDAYVFSYKYNPFGYYLDTPIYKYSELDKRKTDVHKRYFVDEMLNTKWFYEYNQNASINKFSTVYVAPVEYKDKEDVLILGKTFLGNENEKALKGGNFKDSFLFFAKDNGKFISEIFPFGAKSQDKNVKDLTEKDIYIVSDKAIFINITSNTKNNILDENLIQGFSKVEYSIASGEELKRNYFSWNQLSQYLNIDENGFVKNEDEPNYYLYLHNTFMKDNGNTIFIFEQYKPIADNILLSSGAKINDLFFMELDSDMKLVQFERIKKDKKTIRNGIKMNGSQVAAYGWFDYAGYQDLGGDDYHFFYYNRQKQEDGGKKQWILGIVSYIDGKFSEQKLPLKSEDGSDMSISPAKKGYIMIYETFKDKDKSPELRLEKIN